MKQITKIFMVIFALSMPFSAVAQETEKKGFWASLVPDNSSAVTIVNQGKSFFGQLFEDTKDTGKTLLDGGKSIIDTTGETIKSITDGE